MFPTFLVGNFFMRRPVQWNYAAGAAHGSRGEQEKSVPARFKKADPCSGIMPLARRTGRAASRRKSVPARFKKAGARKESSCCRVKFYK